MLCSAGGTRRPHEGVRRFVHLMAEEDIHRAIDVNEYPDSVTKSLTADICPSNIPSVGTSLTPSANTALSVSSKSNSHFEVANVFRLRSCSQEGVSLDLGVVTLC